MFQTSSQMGAVSPACLRPVIKAIRHAEGFTIQFTDAGTVGFFIAITVNGPIQNAKVASRIYAAVALILTDRRAVLVHERVFASTSSKNDLVLARHHAFSIAGIDPHTPLSMIQGQPTWGEGISGAFFHAVPTDTAQVETHYFDEKPIGRSWASATGDYLILQLSGNVSPVEDLQCQADGLFTVAERQLAECSFSFSDVTRTWFYIRDILQHYDEFNRVRDKHYARFGLMPKPPARLCLPASTAIGAAPVNGAALVTNILAVKPKNKKPVQRLSNPGQKEAFDYGASFARATLIQERDVNLIQVSGTASIGEDGKTLHPGDGTAQIACTLDKLEALLETASARLDQIATANIFVKDAGLIKIFQKIATERGLNNLPGVAIIADVCRDDLLFEIDAEVVVPREVSGEVSREAPKRCQ